jgi:hypothetical protein
MEGMQMANQSLDQTPPTEFIKRQHNAERLISRIEEQGVALGTLITTAAVVYDETRRELDAIVNKKGRTPGHQRYIEERAASLQSIFDGAMNATVKTAALNIINQGPTEIVRTIYVHDEPEPRKSRFQSLFGS